MRVTVSYAACNATARRLLLRSAACDDKLITACERFEHLSLQHLLLHTQKQAGLQKTWSQLKMQYKEKKKLGLLVNETGASPTLRIILGSYLIVPVINSICFVITEETASTDSQPNFLLTVHPTLIPWFNKSEITP
jgi:hypothetical protein